MLVKDSSDLLSSYKPSSKPICKVQISYKSMQTIIGHKHAIDFHFLRDFFGITLSKDRNPTVLSTSITNENVSIVKNSFTTPVYIRLNEDQPWKNLLVTDSFDIQDEAFVKIDNYEFKMKKLVFNGSDKKTASHTNSSNQSNKAHNDNIFNNKQTTNHKEDRSHSKNNTPLTKDYSSSNRTRSPISKIGESESTAQPKRGKNVNIWDYFSQVLDGMKELTPNKNPGNHKRSISQDYRRSGSYEIQEEVAPANFQEPVVLTKIETPPNDDKSLLQKRIEVQNLSRIEDQIQDEGLFLKRKARKVEIDEDVEDSSELDNKSKDSCYGKETRAKESADKIEDEEILKESKKKRKKIQIFDDEDEEEEEQKAGFNKRNGSGRKNSGEHRYVVPDSPNQGNKHLMSPQVFKNLQPPRSPMSETSIRSSTAKNHTVAENKFRRLKKLLDDKREGTNKQSVTKIRMTQEPAGEKTEQKEPCPICLSEIQTEIGKLDACTHVFCFNCIKDWSDVTNECPLCKRRFNEITKFAVEEGGQSAKLDVIKVEFKKQRVHEDENYVGEEEEVDDCCYECQTNDDQSVLLICDSCSFYCCHIYCCNPPLDRIPEEDWFCKYCSQSFQGSRRRNNNTTNSNDLRQGSNGRSALPQRLTRNSRRAGQSLLEHLFLLSDDAYLDDVPIPEEVDDEEEEEDDQEDDDEGEETLSFDSSEPRQTHHSNRPQNRNNQRRSQRRNNRSSRRNEESINTRTNRNTRNNRSIVSSSDLDEFSFDSGEVRRNPARARRNLFSSEMSIENFSGSRSGVSVDGLNQFRYPLRNQGRDN